jgi:hypothetical protein
MKTTQKITRVQLKVNQKIDSIIFGIVSSEPDYKLSLALNNKLKISLRHTSPVILPFESGSDLIFSRFSNSGTSSDLIFDLISNRHGKNFLLRKLKNVDYIFQVHNSDNEENIETLISSLRDTECVTAVFSLDSGMLKDKNLRYVTH